MDGHHGMFNLPSDSAWIGIRMYGMQRHVEFGLSRPRTAQLLQDRSGGSQGKPLLRWISGGCLAMI